MTIALPCASRAAPSPRVGGARDLAGPAGIFRGVELALALAVAWTCGLAACSQDCGLDCVDADGGADGGGCGAIAVEVGGADKEGAGWVDWGGGGASAAMIRGPQGGQHIWVRTRSRCLWQKKARIDVTMTLVDTGVVVKPGTVPVMQTLTPEPDGADLSPGITAYVKCPCQVVGRSVRVAADIVDLYGLTGKATAQITPTWDGDCSLPPAGNCAEQ